MTILCTDAMNWYTWRGYKWRVNLNDYDTLNAWYEVEFAHTMIL